MLSFDLPNMSGFLHQGETLTKELLYSFIKTLHVAVHMSNPRNTASIGNVVYQAGEKRTACKDSSFIFHEMGWDLTLIHDIENNLLAA